MRIRKTANDIKQAFSYAKGIRQLLTQGPHGLCIFDSTPDNHRTIPVLSKTF
jgi:hypothetical protein